MWLYNEVYSIIYDRIIYPYLCEVPRTIEWLCNRSALEWIINQYCVKIDKRSGIVNDPNRADDPQYIVKLIGKVITVSLETVKVVERLPDLA